MFCEKCGNNLNQEDQFCMKCGNPVPDTGAQPVNTAPVQSKEPKKPLSPKTKKLIILSSVGAGVIVAVLIILFAVVLPIMNRVDPSEYIKVKFNESMLYENLVSGSVTFDSDAIYNEYLNDGETAEEKLDDIVSGDYGWDDFTSDITSSSTGVESIFQYCDINVTVKGAEATEDTSADDSTDTASFTNLSSDDTIVVTLKWDNSESGQKMIANAEKTVGISFDKSDKTIELKISDELAKNSLTIKEPVNVDFFKYFDENNVVKSTGISDGELSFEIGAFTFTEGDYTFTKEEDRSQVLIEYGDGLEQTISIGADEDTYLYNGDEVEVEITGNGSNIVDNHILGTDVFITETSKTYTVEANAPMNADIAKSNADIIKNSALEILNSYNYTVTIEEIYLLEANTEYLSPQNEIVILYRNNEGDKSYGSFSFENVYIDDDVLVYERDGSNFVAIDDTLKQVREGSNELNNTFYTKTKIA